MAFLLDAEELKPGLIIFRRADVKHHNFYCRVKLPKTDRYKLVSLKTADRGVAREKAFDYDADVRFRIKHDVPVFNRPFSQVAEDYLATQKERAETGGISEARAKNIESAIRTLNLYVGSSQIHLVGQDKWNSYPTWRRRQERRVKEDKKGTQRKGVASPSDQEQKKKVTKPWRVSDWTIRAEMTVFRSIMAYAASKKYIPESQIFKGKLHSAKERREEFTREEYRALHTKGRAWMRKARTRASKWYREITYNFMLVMCNTGMRPPEAKNLRWRDVTITTVRKETRGRENKNEEILLGQNQGKAGGPEAANKEQGKKVEEQRKIVILNVRGKDKFRRLVAPSNAAEYLERIRAIAKVTGPDDHVFTTHNGKPNRALYAFLIKDLITDAKLLIGPLGSERSTYSFRHTYATLRLSEGVDVYLLAEQMGTSVQIIQDHYGHINPVKNADRILMGMHEWETPETGQESEGAAETARVKKGAAATIGAKAQAANSGRVNAGRAAKGARLNNKRHKPRR
jgi:integrase